MHKLIDLQPKKIAIFRALQLGDLLCSIPAIRALKKACPHCEVTLIGLPWASVLVKRFPEYFSDFIHFPGYPGIIEQPFQPRAFIDFLEKMNKEKFDLVLQMHGNGSLINPMIQMLGAKRTAGFFEQGRYCPDQELYCPYPEGFNEVERHLKLMEFLGISPDGVGMEFPLYETDFQSFQKLTINFNLKPGKYVCVHSGARDTKRWWGPEKFASVANMMAEKGYTIVLTGTEAEAETVKKVEQRLVYPALNLTAKTDLGTLAALVKNSKMLFSNDTGVSHIASSLEIPSVIIFLASDPVRWAPLNKELHHIILPQEADNIDFVISKVEDVLRIEHVEV